MANTIQIKRGVKALIPALAVGELGYCTDSKELFIGAAGGNVLVASGTSVPVTGLYTGSGGMQTVNIGFKPSVVLVGILGSGGPAATPLYWAELADSGFTVYGDTENTGGGSYRYMAWR